MPTANSTKSGLEYFFESRKDLPAFIEDIDSVTDDKSKTTLAELPYQFCNGVGRLRANKDGGLRDIIEFRGSLISTGEHPLTTDTSRGGGKRRLLEIYVPDNFIDEQAAKDINTVFDDHFGLFGRPWINFLLQSKPSTLKSYVTDFMYGTSADAPPIGASINRAEACDNLFEPPFKCKGLFTDCTNKIPLHIRNVAVIAVANALFYIHILNADVNSTFRREYERACRVLGGLPNNRDIADWQRAKDAIIDWLAINDKSFTKPIGSGVDYDTNTNKPAGADGGYASYQFFGVKRGKYVAVVPSVLRKFLDDSGFSSKTVIKQLADHGFFKTNGRHFDASVKFEGKVFRMFVIPNDQIETADDGSPVLESDNVQYEINARADEQQYNKRRRSYPSLDPAVYNAEGPTNQNQQTDKLPDVYDNSRD